MRALAPLALLAAAGCSPSPVIVEAGFPTQTSFLHSEQGRLRIFRLGPDELGLCPELLDGVAMSRFVLEPVYDSGLQDGCWFYEGAALPELGGGPHAFVIEMRSAGSGVILQGCALGEVVADAGTIRVELHPTTGYDAALAETPVTGTAATRCGGAP
jgi:hypothetical protein